MQYFSKGEIFYHVKNMPFHIRLIWNIAIFGGGGDTHQSMTKGARSPTCWCSSCLNAA